MSDEQKYLEVDKPVSKKKTLELNAIIRHMQHDMQGTHNSCSLSVNSITYDLNNGVWTRRTKIKNPQYNPKKIKYGNAYCNANGDIQIVLFSYPIGITDFHSKIMKLFKRLGWKYTSPMQVECFSEPETNLWENSTLPKYNISMNGYVTKVQSQEK